VKLSEIGKDGRKNEKLQWKYYLSEDDEVVIPKINFNIETNYPTLEGHKFQTEERNYTIITAWQRTAFILNEKGAEIESLVISMVLSEEENGEENLRPKKMIFDKPFLILLKRTYSQNPYFGLWAANTELMIKE